MVARLGQTRSGGRTAVPIQGRARGVLATPISDAAWQPSLPARGGQHPGKPAGPSGQHGPPQTGWRETGGERRAEETGGRGGGRRMGAKSAGVRGGEVLSRCLAHRRQLASYVGIAPMPYQSGGMDRDRSISRAGNPRARTTLIQLAWLWLRYQPGSALSDWFRGRVGTLQGRTRRIAIVAMARKLLIALWRYVETGVLPDA